MDLSKLPRLSKTPPGPPADGPAGTDPVTGTPADGTHRPAPLAYRPAPPDDPGAGPQAWISIAIAGLILFMNPTFLVFLSHWLRGEPYRPFVDPTADYHASLNFWRDLVITAFAVVLILDGLVMLFARKSLLVLTAFVMTVAATVGNLIYLIYSYPSDGLALESALAVIFGVFIAMQQWRTLQAIRPVPTYA